MSVEGWYSTLYAETQQHIQYCSTQFAKNWGDSQYCRYISHYNGNYQWFNINRWLLYLPFFVSAPIQYYMEADAWKINFLIECSWNIFDEWLTIIHGRKWAVRSTCEGHNNFYVISEQQIRQTPLWLDQRIQLHPIMAYTRWMSLRGINAMTDFLHSAYMLWRVDHVPFEKFE